MGRIVEFFHDDDRQLSMTRLITAVVVFAYVCWATSIVIIRQEIPDIPTGLAGLLVGLYGFNRINVSVGGNDRKP